MPSDVPDDMLSPGRFIKELWSIAPKDWFGEFFLIRYQPTQENPDAKVTPTLFWTIEQVLSDWPTIEAALDRQNRTKVFNVHPCVNPRFQKPKKRGKNSDVSHYVALWIDVDFHGDEAEIRKRFQETVKIFTDAGIPPSIIVESGHGLHAYWLLDKPYPSAEARPLCAGVQDTFQISDAVHDPSRVLRMPGTVNLKDAKHPAECRVVEATYRRYPLKAFAEYAVEPGKSPEDAEEEKLQKQVKSSKKSQNKDIEWAKTHVVREGEGPFGGRHNTAKAMAGHYASDRSVTSLDAVQEKLSAWNKSLCEPPVGDEQIEGCSKFAWENEVEKRDKKERKKADGSQYFNGKMFMPERLALEICKKHEFIATPISDDGTGVRIHIYQNGVFRSGGESVVVDEAYAALKEYVNDNRAKETSKNIRISKKKDYAELNASAKTLINVKNGMLDWKEGKLALHDKKYLSTIQIDADFIPDVKSDLLDQFFERVFPADEIPVVEEFIGYLLIPDTSFNKCLVFVGEGGNGKTQCMDLIIGFLGEKNVSHYSLQHISEEKFSVAGLFGSLANFYDELQTKQIRDTATFKIITGGSPLKAEDKGKAPFSFRPFCRLVFSANEMPRADDRSQAYFDRFIFIKLPNRIRGTRVEIRDYAKVLLTKPEVRSALLAKGVAGLRRLVDQGRFSVSRSSVEAIEEYRRECNSAYDFVKEYCTFEDPTSWISKQDTYSRYRAWCGETGRKAMSDRGFSKSMESLNVRSVRHKEARGWGGLSWANGRPPESVSEDIEKMGDDHHDDTDSESGKHGF